MKESNNKSYEELSLFLDAEMVVGMPGECHVLGV